MALGCTVLIQGVHILKHCMALSNLPPPHHVCFTLVFLRQSHYAVLASDSQAPAVFLPQPFKSLDLQVFKPPNMALPALIYCCVLKPCARW